MTEPIKIKGGAYKWVDSKDGYKIVLDVPLVAKFTKGTKGIEYEGDKNTLEQYVTHGQKRHGEGFCATAYKGHNQDVPLTHPDFAGFVLPTKVDTAKTEQGDVLATFGNVKITDAQFEQAKAGKLPYLSPEISRFQKKIRGLAFLDTLPPHNEFPLFTIGEEVKDSVATFSAQPDTANFAEEEAKPKKDFASDYPEANTMLKDISEGIAKLAAANGRIGADPSLQKPNPLPAEPSAPKEAKMSMDPEFAAKFAAQANDLAEIKAKFAAQERGTKVAALVAKADAALSRKIIDKGVRDSIIAKFASDAVDMKDGDTWFDKTIEALKPSLKDKPTALGDTATFEGGEVSDPVVAKFVKDGADASEVARFGARYDALKKLPSGRFFSFDKEAYIKSEMGLAKARANGAFSENRG